MQLGMIGLGRMGANIVRRLQRAGHACAVHDVDPAAIAALAADGATPAPALADLARVLAPPRHVWVMVPAAITRAVIEEVAGVLDVGDVIIDGGNSYFRDGMSLGADLSARGLHFVDVGTSGGVFGLERGYCLMVGGDDEAVDRLAPIFDTLAPGVEGAPRTGDRTGELAAGEKGWLHCGPTGAGHFVKMVHNGIEYGAMAALAEGLAILERADLGTVEHARDAETAPLQDPESYRFDIDLAAVTEVWRRGSVISSFLLDLTAAALADDPALSGYRGDVADSGEGRWTIKTAVDLGVPAHTLTAALYERFSSRGLATFADRVLSAMRNEFGGHPEVHHQ